MARAQRGRMRIPAVASCIRSPRARIRALDLDPLRHGLDRLARTLRGRDFLEWSCSTVERFSKVGRESAVRCAESGERGCAKGSTGDPTAVWEARFLCGANCWLAFLCASIALLRPTGSLGFVLPAAWLYADYAASLRREIATLFEDVEVHHSRRPLFASVQEGSVVLLARGLLAKASSVAGHIRQCQYETGEELIRGLEC